MSEHLEDTPSAFSCEALYRIVVRGAIADSWKERLSGMKVIQEDGSGGVRVSVLEGTLKDQADLNGLLETLYRLHVTIISVQRLES